MDEDIAYYEQYLQDDFEYEADLEAMRELEEEAAQAVKPTQPAKSTQNEADPGNLEIAEDDSFDDDFPPFENEENIPPEMEKNHENITFFIFVFFTHFLIG